MIDFLNTITNDYNLIINFVSYNLIFIGTFYVALHNRKLPQWHIAPLWYVGLSSFATSITILIQWLLGPENPLSYSNFGQISEMFVHVTLASVATIMLVGTVRRDLKYSKLRRKDLT